VEVGESLEAAILRELSEETGLEARVVCPLEVVTLAREGFVYVIHEHLLVPVGDARLRPGDDAADARWVSRRELGALNVEADAIAVIDRGLREARVRGLSCGTEGQ
jgi:ADP-ribose pyrophosphatase YjhB (NUDIX family)